MWGGSSLGDVKIPKAIGNTWETTVKEWKINKSTHDPNDVALIENDITVALDSLYVPYDIEINYKSKNGTISKNLPFIQCIKFKRDPPPRATAAK